MTYLMRTVVLALIWCSLGCTTDGESDPAIPVDTVEQSTPELQDSATADTVMARDTASLAVAP